MANRDTDKWWLNATEARVPVSRPRMVLAAWGMTLGLVIAVILTAAVTDDLDEDIGVSTILGVGFGTLAVWVCFLMASAGRIQIEGDRLEWRPRLGRTRVVFLRGHERVRFTTRGAVVEEGRHRVVLRYDLKAYPRLHALLCERSEAFRAAQDLQIPVEFSSGPASFVQRNRRAFSTVFVILLIFTMFTQASSIGPGMWFWLFLLIPLLFTLKSRPDSEEPASQHYRFDEGLVEVVRGKMHQRLEEPHLKTARHTGDVLVLRFERRKIPVKIRQQHVQYPLAVLKEKAEGWYTPQQPAPVTPEQEKAIAPPPEPEPPSQDDTWNVFG